MDLNNKLTAVRPRISLRCAPVRQIWRSTTLSLDCQRQRRLKLTTNRILVKLSRSKNSVWKNTTIIKPNQKHKYRYSFFAQETFLFPKNLTKTNIVWKDGQFNKVTDSSSLLVFQNLFVSHIYAMNSGY